MARHVDAAFNEDERRQFFEGLSVPCRSEKVGSARWDDENQRLYCDIIGAGPYSYPCNRGEAEQFADAASKMGFIWDHYLYRGEKGRKES